MGKSTRLRTRLAVLMVPCLAAAVAVVTVSWPADAAGTVDTNIDHYTLFAQDEINMKGGVVNGGHVGVNSPVGMANVCANDLFSMTAGSQFISNTARLTELCKLYNVFANNVLGDGFTPLTPPMVGFTPPIIPAGIPMVPRASAGATTTPVRTPAPAGSTSTSRVGPRPRSTRARSTTSP